MLRSHGKTEYSRLGYETRVFSNSLVSFNRRLSDVILLLTLQLDRQPRKDTLVFGGNASFYCTVEKDAAKGFPDSSQCVSLFYVSLPTLPPVVKIIFAKEKEKKKKKKRKKRKKRGNKAISLSHATFLLRIMRLIVK